MLWNRSDVNKRLPVYTEIVDAVNMARVLGAYDDISPAIGDLFDAAEPVGLNWRRNIVWPQPYLPDLHPPILAALPKERNRRYVYRWSADMRQATDVLLERIGIEAPAPTRAPRSKGSLSRSHVTYVTATIDGKGSAVECYLPRAIILSKTLGSLALMPAEVAHELDHWDFFLNRAPMIAKELNRPVPAEEMVVMSEKRAYKTTYAVEQRLGLHAGMPTIEQFAEQCGQWTPGEASGVVDVFTAATKQAGITANLSASLSALALSHIFGTVDSLYVTAAEVAAYRAAQLA